MATSGFKEQQQEQHFASSLHLQQVHILRRMLRRREGFESFHHVKEYRLHGKPSSLKALIDRCLVRGNGQIDYNRVIWMKGNAFVCFEDEDGLYLPDRFPTVSKFYREQYVLVLRSRGAGGQNGPISSRCRLQIYGSAPQETSALLDFLFGLADDFFHKITLKLSRYDDEDEGPGTSDDESGELTCAQVLGRCPLSSHCLENLPRNHPERQCEFREMYFLPDQCRALSTDRQLIRLVHCQVDDGREQQPTLSLAKMDNRLCHRRTKSSQMVAC